MPDILNYSILKTDSNFVVEAKSAFREKDKYTSYTAQNNTVYSNNTLYYHQPFNDTVFSMNKDGQLQYDYIFNFGKHTMPKEFLLTENYARMRNISKSEPYVSFIGNFVPTNDCIYTSFSTKGIVFNCFYFVKSQKLFYGGCADDMYYLSFSLDNVLTSI